MLAANDANRGVRPTEPTFVVVVADPFTAEVDVFGPFDKVGGDAEVERRRRELDAEELADVIVVLVRLNPPPGAT